MDASEDKKALAASRTSEAASARLVPFPPTPDQLNPLNAYPHLAGDLGGTHAPVNFVPFRIRTSIIHSTKPDPPRSHTTG